MEHFEFDIPMVCSSVSGRFVLSGGEYNVEISDIIVIVLEERQSFHNIWPRHRGEWVRK